VKKPNFFIIGMPRCGTTALSEYLRSHPNIFFPTIKELRFFLPKECQFFRINNLKDYLDCFTKVEKKHVAIGEGTPSYYMHESAIKKILAFNHDAKFILMLRDPVERFFSTHKQLCFYGVEKNHNPQTVLERIKALKGNTPLDNQYLQIRLTNFYVETLLKLIKKEKLHVILFDDFKNHTKEAYEKILKFLQVPIIFIEKFPKINESSLIVRPKLQKLLCLGHRLYWFLMKNRRIKNDCIVSIIKTMKPLSKRLTSKEIHTEHCEQFIFELKAYFQEDVCALANTLDDKRILHWLSIPKV